MWLLFLILAIAGLVSVFCTASKAQEEDNPWPFAISCLAMVIFGGIFLWMTRAWWHWLWFNCFYMAPTFWIIVAVFAIPTIWLAVKERVNLAWTAALLGILALIAVPILAAPMTMSKLYNEIGSARTIDALPETTEVRYLPMEVAQYYGENKVQESEVKLGDFDPVLHDGELTWMAPREQDGMIRSLKFQTNGVALIKSDGSVISVKESMKYGEGMKILDNILWKLREHKYFVDYCEIYYIFDGDTPVAVVPYLGYKYSFPVMVPYWAGVAMVYPDGTIQDYTPEEAQALPFTQGHRLFPEKLARLYAQSWAYKYGIANKWFTHKDQIEIPNIANSQNEMPYYLPTANGPKWVLTAEPSGSAFGLSKIFFIDARTGAIEIFEAIVWNEETQEYETKVNLIGPNRAWDYAKGIPTVENLKWLESDGSGTWKLLEPRPVVSQGKFYWMLSVTTQKHAGVNYTLLVDAQDPEEGSFACESETSLKKFLAGGVITTIVPTESGELPEGDSVAQQLERIEKLWQEVEKEIQKLKEMLE